MNEKFYAYKCLACGDVIYPKRSRCPKCKETEFEAVELENGQLITYSTVHAVGPGTSKPLLLCIAEFEYGVRAIGQLDAADPQVGMKLQPAHGILREQNSKQYSGFKFKKV